MATISRSPAIGTTTSGPHPGAPIGALAVGATADAAEIEDADSAEIGAETAAETDPEDHLSDDPGDDLEDDPEGDTDAEVSVGDPEMRYLPPGRAVKWLKSQGIRTDLATLRRWMAAGVGPAHARFDHGAGQGGLKIRHDQLSQWAAFRFGLDLSP